VFTRAVTVSFYGLSDYVQSDFGRSATRQPGQFYTDDSLTRYEDDVSTDVALRYTNSFSTGDWGLGPVFLVQQERNRAAVLAGYQAGPTVTDSAGNAGIGDLTALTPYYQQIRQFALNTVYAQGDTNYCQIWCLKIVGHAAIWLGLMASIPSLNVTLVMTLGR